jgi:hypothetical protein
MKFSNPLSLSDREFLFEAPAPYIRRTRGLFERSYNQLTLLATCGARTHACSVHTPVNATCITAIRASPAEGKQRTRLNAYKHGLTGQIHILTAAEQTAFDAHCKGICEALAPIGALEIDIAQAIAENRWRLKRVRAMETGIFAAGRQDALGFLPTGDPTENDPEQVLIDEAINQARSWLAKSDHFQLFTLYEQRINRTIERNMAELRTLRTERKAARDQALEEAVLLAQLAQSKGEKYDPTPDFPPELLGIGSDFSVAAVTLLIARTQRLNEARDYAKTPVNPKQARQMPAAA